MADNTQPIDDSAVVLTDDFGRFLPCQVEQSFTLSDREYLLLLPIDSPIEIFVWQQDDNDEEVLMDVEEDDIDDIFLTAKAVLAEQNLTLQRTAITLTAAGDVPARFTPSGALLDEQGQLIAYELVPLVGEAFQVDMVARDGYSPPISCSADLNNRALPRLAPDSQEAPNLLASITVTPSPTNTPTVTPSATLTATATFTASATSTHTPSPTSTLTATITPSLTPSLTFTPQATNTPIPSNTPELGPGAGAAPTNSPMAASPTAAVPSSTPGIPFPTPKP